MRDKTKLPEGWKATFSRSMCGIGYDLTREGDTAHYVGNGEDWAEAERKAIAYAWAYVDGDKAPPAWMVEVAREIGARICERQNYPQGAKAYRDGDHDNSNGVQGSVSALRLALERGHVVEPREWTEEELLAAAREDAAQVNDVRLPGWSKAVRAGEQDDHGEVQSALQARRNMLREGAVGGTAKAPEVDLEDVLERAWENGWSAAGLALSGLKLGAIGENKLFDGMRESDVARLLSTLPTREA
ncbi:hypothetical protein VQ02_23450 [Methylobacterium variabile]|uniref:Uncharacterized protein n=1 Tax=Methylobacterium variabile TaxID=298794 RepID=A0A0J6V149_9HYPH|nr:hypothetical protein [Methylobacterium variabile]KMO32506.1 hypothetical protein VQ02_23450 [Methylobacterium variabile]